MCARWECSNHLGEDQIKTTKMSDCTPVEASTHPVHPCGTDKHAIQGPLQDMCRLSITPMFDT